MTEFTIVIEAAGENLSAYVADLPGCVVTGVSIEEREGACRFRHCESVARSLWDARWGRWGRRLHERRKDRTTSVV
jgi:hypothetical protein